MSVGADEILEPLIPAGPGGVGVLLTWSEEDGRVRLVSSGTDGVIRIWDPVTGERIAELKGHAETVLALALCEWNGSRMLISADEDGMIWRWDVQRFAPVGGPIRAHAGWARSLATWIDDDRRPWFASVGEDRTVKVWDPLAVDGAGWTLIRDTGDELAALVAWPAPDGVRLAVGADHGHITMWDPRDRRQVGEVRQPAGLWALAAWFDADIGGARLASAGDDGVIRIWDPMAGVAAGAPLVGHTNWVPCLAAITTGAGACLLLSASSDGTMRIWDVRAQEQLGSPVPTSPSSTPTLAAWTAPDGSVRASFVGSGGFIDAIDIATREEIGPPLPGHTAGMWALAGWAERDGGRLATGGDGGVIRIWDVDFGEPVDAGRQGHTASVWALVSWLDRSGVRHLASSGDDGAVRVWPLDGRGGAPLVLAGHSGWVPALARWDRPGGGTGLASAGINATIRRWDAGTGNPIGAPLGDPDEAHGRWVSALVGWASPDGPRLASGSADGTIRIWDPETGDLLGPPLVGHTAWVRALAVWQGGGRTRLISAGYDGRVRIWDPSRPDQTPVALLDSDHKMASLVTWTAPSGEARLAAGSADGLVRIWDLDRAVLLAPPLAGHRGGVWALAVLDDGHSGIRVASTGHDGTVRLWDAATGQAGRVIPVTEVTLTAFSDAAADRDLIGRQELAEAIADQLTSPGEAVAGLGGNPVTGVTVVSIEGPWGSGKSTLMRLVRGLLPPPVALTRRRRAGHLRVGAVLRQLRLYSEEDGKPPPRSRRLRPIRTVLRRLLRRRSSSVATRSRTVVTAWFNPWGYQSGEQVWAGLARAIIDAAKPVLYPTEIERERYWFERNLPRVDRHAIRRSILRSTISPALGVALAAVIAPLVIAVADLNQPVEVGSFTLLPSTVAIALGLLGLVGGLGHTWVRRRWGRALDYLPTEMFNGPVADGFNVGRADEPGDADPLRRARAGSLYLNQHNIGDIIHDLDQQGCDLVVFVDDLDRCRADTTAKVVEAINLFLANVTSPSGLQGRFVLALDSTVVARHLDAPYQGLADPLPDQADDPSPGWAVLRKLIQLPVIVPQVSDEGVRRLVDELLADPDAEPATAPDHPGRPLGGARREVGPAGVPRQRGGPVPVPAAPEAGRAEDAPRDGGRSNGAKVEAVRAEAVRAGRGRGKGGRDDRGRQRSEGPGETGRPAGRGIVERDDGGRGPQPVPRRVPLQRHPAVQALINERFAALPDRSIREQKRLLNVWQFYVRILRIDAIPQRWQAIAQARSLVILAEIVTRWPAMQRSLHTRIGDQRGLGILAAAAADDDAWAAAVVRVGVARLAGPGSLDVLRGLLREHDGRAIAELAGRVM